MAKATNEGPAAWIIPSDQSRVVEAADMMNLLRLMGVEVHRADKEIVVKDQKFPAGSYVIVEGVRYNLLEFHFHQPSEHTLNGNRIPMEVHFVHLRADTQDSRTPAPGFTDCRLVDRPALAQACARVASRRARNG